MSEQKRKDLVILGSGPAGLSAAVYAQRAMLDQVVIEKEMFSGGQIVTTDRIDNYLGLYGENGYDISVKFREHADALNVPFIEDEVTELLDREDYMEVHLAGGDTLLANNIILATGAKHRLLGVEGESRLSGAGVSYCATCDGAFFRNQNVAVVGGGDVALEDALYLAKTCKHVYLIHRRDTLRGTKVLQNKVFETENITFLPNYEVEEIIGEQSVEKIRLKSNRAADKKELEISGIFIAIGMEPQSNLVKGLVEMDDNGYVIAGEDCKTSHKLIYAAGDVRTKSLRQVITAAADGAAAVYAIERKD